MTFPVPTRLAVIYAITETSAASVAKATTDTVARLRTSSSNMMAVMDGMTDGAVGQPLDGSESIAFELTDGTPRYWWVYLVIAAGVAVVLVIVAAILCGVKKDKEE